MKLCLSSPTHPEIFAFCQEWDEMIKVRAPLLQLKTIRNWFRQYVKCQNGLHLCAELHSVHEVALNVHIRSSDEKTFLAKFLSNMLQAYIHEGFYLQMLLRRKCFPTLQVPSTSLYFIAIFSAAVDQRLLPPQVETQYLCMPAGHSVPVFILPRSRLSGKWWPNGGQQNLLTGSLWFPLLIPWCTATVHSFPQSRYAVSSPRHRILCLCVCWHLMRIFKCTSHRYGGSAPWHILPCSHTQVFSLWLCLRMGMSVFPQHLKSTYHLTWLKQAPDSNVTQLCDHIYSLSINTTSIQLVWKDLCCVILIATQIAILIFSLFINSVNDDWICKNLYFSLANFEAYIYKNCHNAAYYTSFSN